MLLQATKCQLQPNQSFKNVKCSVSNAGWKSEGDLQELQHGLAHISIQAVLLQQLLLQPYRLPQVCA